MTDVIGMYARARAASAHYGMSCEEEETVTEPDEDKAAPDPQPKRGVRDLTDEEYDATYAEGSGGHELPVDVLAELNDEEDADG